jgi:hypothetical protein
MGPHARASINTVYLDSRQQVIARPCLNVSIHHPLIKQVQYQHDNREFHLPCGPTTSQVTTRPRGWRASADDRMQPAEARTVGTVQ